MTDAQLESQLRRAFTCESGHDLPDRLSLGARARLRGAKRRRDVLVVGLSLVSVAAAALVLLADASATGDSPSSYVGEDGVVSPTHVAGVKRKKPKKPSKSKAKQPAPPSPAPSASIEQLREENRVLKAKLDALAAKERELEARERKLKEAQDALREAEMREVERKLHERRKTRPFSVLPESHDASLMAKFKCSACHPSDKFGNACRATSCASAPKSACCMLETAKKRGQRGAASAPKKSTSD